MVIHYMGAGVNIPCVLIACCYGTVNNKDTISFITSLAIQMHVKCRITLALPLLRTSIGGVALVASWPAHAPYLNMDNSPTLPGVVVTAVV